MGQLVYLSLGSNLGDRFTHLKNALELIKLDGNRLVAVSKMYTTPPLGFESTDEFINLCACFETILDPLQLLNNLKAIEVKLGRQKKSSNNTYESRVIDIDIILYADVIVQTQELTIPHPKFKERLFVIRPLEDISATITDPQSGKTVAQLHSECADQSIISIYAQ